MRRRRFLATLLALGGCGLSERPYEAQRNWPLTATRPTTLPPRRSGKVLLVRSVQAGAGLERRGLQSLQADGSLGVGFYDQWAVPPADAVDAAMRQWLAASGLFAAVLAPGSRERADLVLESELTALIAEPAAGHARMSVTIVVLDARASTSRVLLQATETAEIPLASADATAEVDAQRAAMAAVLGRIEQAIAPFA